MRLGKRKVSAPHQRGCRGFSFTSGLFRHLILVCLMVIQAVSRQSTLRKDELKVCEIVANQHIRPSTKNGDCGRTIL